MKVFLFLAFMFMYAPFLNGSVVVFGDTKSISNNINNIYKDVFSVFRKDVGNQINELNGKYSSLGLKFEFLPDFAYQILIMDSTAKEPPAKRGLFWDKLTPQSFNKYSTYNKRSLVYSENDKTYEQEKAFLGNMLRLNKNGGTSGELINKAGQLVSEYYQASKHNKSNVLTFIDPSLFREVMRIETEAFQKGHTILWRFTRGLSNEEVPLDSILLLTNDLQTINPVVDTGRGLRTSGLSYARSLLDGIKKDFLYVEDPYKDYSMASAPASTFGFLANHLNQLTNLQKSKELKSGETTKEDERIKHMSNYALYYISVPTEELDRLAQYFFDPRGVTKSFNGLEAYGEYFHPALTFKSKGFMDRFVPYEGQPLKQTEQVGENRKLLVRVWHEWMAKYMKVLFTDNRVIPEGEQTPQEHAYKSFAAGRLSEFTNSGVEITEKSGESAEEKASAEQATEDIWKQIEAEREKEKQSN